MCGTAPGITSVYSMNLLYISAEMRENRKFYFPSELRTRLLNEISRRSRKDEMENDGG